MYMLLRTGYRHLMCGRAEGWVFICTEREGDIKWPTTVVRKEGKKSVTKVF